MDAPSVLLVPPTPSKYDIPPLTSSPSISVASTSRTQSDLRDSFGGSRGRQSSESAIVSIYSMYGDDGAMDGRTSWIGPRESMVVDLKPIRKSSPIPRVNLTPDVDMENDGDGTELAYFRPSSTMSKSTASRTSGLAKPAVLATANGSANINQHPNSDRFSSAERRSLDHSDNINRRASMGQNCRSSDLSSSTSVTSHSEAGHTSSRMSAEISISSRKRHSQQSIRDRPPPVPRATPPPTPPTSFSPGFLSIPATPSSQKVSPPSTHSLPLKHPPFKYSPSCHSSLVPSEGEDLDAFHVRNTYAQLESSGVKGDGYEDGVERTRARIGSSRDSQLCAEGAIGDGTEKSKELDPKEIATLAQVDRYGFFTIPSHDRLVLLPLASLSKQLSRVTAGPRNADTSARTLSAIPPTLPPKREESRIAKWTRMLYPAKRDSGSNVQVWDVRPSKANKIRERTYKGVPDRWRPAAWEIMMRRYSNVDASQLSRLGEDYRKALDRPSEYDIQIDLDVPRTVSGHIMFKTRYGAGQRSLFHVLHCFSLRCSTCGYVQGMGPIAATLLCYFDPERAYASLVRLHDSYAMHAIFGPGFPGLLEAIYVQERLTEQMMPDVYSSFKKNMISTTSYATKWYITLFSNSVPFQTQLRLWDIFLLEGPDVFVAVAVAIVWAFRDHITASGANFETVLSLLSSFFVPEEEDALLQWIEKALGDAKIRAQMKSWRNDWQALVASGKDTDALL